MNFYPWLTDYDNYRRQTDKRTALSYKEFMIHRIEDFKKFIDSLARFLGWQNLTQQTHS